MMCTQDMSLGPPVLNGTAVRGICKFHELEYSALYNGSILILISALMFGMKCSEDMNLRLPVLNGAAVRGI
jgi:hypothetical protein